MNSNSLLNVGQFYTLDLGSNFGLGIRYCKVLNRYEGAGDADFTLDSSDILGEVDVCSPDVIFRYHRFKTFTTLQRAEENLCGASSDDDGLWIVNLRISQLLDNGKTYLKNLGNGLGTRYCQVLNRYTGAGDADFTLNLDYSSTTPVIIDCSTYDSDGDGILDIDDNCPNNSNVNQADLDQDEIGNVCDDDRDSDGITNTSDDCPTISGIVLILDVQEIRIL